MPTLKMPGVIIKVQTHHAMHQLNHPGTTSDNHHLSGL
jgi:hypothetical protein